MFFFIIDSYACRFASAMIWTSFTSSWVKRWNVLPPFFRAIWHLLKWKFQCWSQSLGRYNCENWIRNRCTLAQSCSCVEPSLAFATGTTSKHQRITWPLLYRKLIERLRIVVWHMRMSTHLLDVTWLECGTGEVICVMLALENEVKPFV